VAFFRIYPVSTILTDASVVGAATAHEALGEITSDEDTTYVQLVDQQVEVGVTPIVPADLEEIIAVKLFWRAKGIGGTATDYALMQAAGVDEEFEFESNGNIVEGSYNDYRFEFPAPPSSSPPWDIAGLESLTAIEFAATAGNTIRLTQFHIEVEYTVTQAQSVSESASCTDDVDNSLGRQSIAVNQPGAGGDNYPLVGSSDIDQLLADAYLSFTDIPCSFVRPFQVLWLYGFGCGKADKNDIDAVAPVHDYDVLIVDSSSEVVFDSREADSFVYSLWGDRLRVLQWTNTVTDSVLRLVQHIAWNEDETPRNWPVFFYPKNGRLDDRVSERLLPRLRSLRVDLGDKLQSRLSLRNGFNTTMATVEPEIADGDRLTTTISIGAAPGSGKGKFGPACGEETTDVPGILRLVNNTQGDESGNFLFDAGGCYRVERPILEVLSDNGIRRVQVRNHSLQISNDCGPCCECDDFINTYEGIRRLRDRYADLYSRASAVRELYAQNRQRFIDSAACRAADPLRVIVRPLCPDEVAVAVGFCNNTDQCLRNLIIPISFEFNGAESLGGCNVATEYTGTGEPGISCNSTFRAGNREENPTQGNSDGSLDFYQLGGRYPHFYAAWEQVDPGGLAQVTFRLNFPGSQPGDQAEVSVDAYAVERPKTGSLLGSTAKTPIPGYTTGVGPVTQAALDARLVDACKVVRTGIFQEECCPEDSFSEV